MSEELKEKLFYQAAYTVGDDPVYKYFDVLASDLKEAKELADLLIPNEHPDVERAEITIKDVILNDASSFS